MKTKVNFVRQQGFKEAPSSACSCQYEALMLQPRVLGILVSVGLVLQAWPYFLALSALLWWNVALPRINPFDALYNHFVAPAGGLLPLGPAPGPRRFAQGMAGTLMLAIALALFSGWGAAAWGFEAFLAVALGALLLGRFCAGSYLYLLLTGQARFANRTLPWARAE